MNVDREHRDRLAKAIRQYLAAECSAFTFDDVIHNICDSSDDPTISYVTRSVWCHYDDCKDHTVNLSKEEWDYFQRMLLLLESDAQIEETRVKTWCFSQLVALIGMAIFCASAVALGFGYHLFILVIPFGILSVGLSKWRRRRRPHLTAYERSLVPFSSVAELLAVRRSVEGFVKQKYPESLRSRRIRSPFMERLMWLQNHVLWMLFSPFVLVVQLLPETELRRGELRCGCK